MKIAVVAFVLGTLCGVSVMIALYLLQPKDESSLAAETLDFLINEWTADRSLILAGMPARLELPDARPGYIPDTVRALARRLDSLYRVPYAVTLAQWALESRWGLSNLGASNYFGHTFPAVKKYMLRPRWVVAREKTIRNGIMTMGDSVRFANYSHIAECFNVHGLYLSQSTRYANAFQQRSPEAFARQLTGRYATDPDYGLKLITIMKRYNLNHAANR